MKVFFHPTKGPYGVGRYIEGLLRELSQFVDVVRNPQDADIYHCNVRRPQGIPKVDIYTFHATAVERNPNVGWQLGLMQQADPRFLIVPSQWQKESLERIAVKRGVPLPEILPIHHGIHFWKLPAKPRYCPNSYILWGKSHLGRVGDNYILADVAARFPKLRFKATLWHEGFRRPPNVELIGQQPFGRMLELMNRCSMMAFTWPESGGIQVLEAMALGKPVLSIAAGGAAEAIEHRNSGYLWRNLSDFCEGIEFCLSYYDGMGVEARKRAQQFTWERSARKHLEVYLRCLA